MTNSMELNLNLLVLLYISFVLYTLYQYVCISFSSLIHIWLSSSPTVLYVSYCQLCTFSALKG